jgi:hypothetical protein
MKKLLTLLALGGFILFTSGCIGTTEGDLQNGTWKLVQFDTSVPNVEFNFKSNGLVIYKNLDVMTIDTGTYTPTASIEHRYIEILGLPIDTTQELETYNGKWTIIKLDESSLIIAIPKQGNGIIQREFENI